jgi:hypothetical protein
MCALCKGVKVMETEHSRTLLPVPGDAWAFKARCLAMQNIAVPAGKAHSLLHLSGQAKLAFRYGAVEEQAADH